MAILTKHDENEPSSNLREIIKFPLRFADDIRLFDWACLIFLAFIKRSHFAFYRTRRAMERSILKEFIICLLHRKQRKVRIQIVKRASKVDFL